MDMMEFADTSETHIELLKRFSSHSDPMFTVQLQESILPLFSLTSKPCLLCRIKIEDAVHFTTNSLIILARPLVNRQVPRFHIAILFKLQNSASISRAKSIGAFP